MIRSCRRGSAFAVVSGCLAGLSDPSVGVALAQTGFVNWESPHVSPLALTPSGTRLLAVNTPDNRLEVFDVSGLPVRLRSVPVGLDPVSVRARTENEAWVVNHLSDSISIVDIPSGRVVRTLLTGDEPCDVVFAGTPQRAFVSISQRNQVWVYNPANLALAPTVLTIEGEEPRALAVSADGTRVYVAIFESGNATGAVLQQDVSNPTSPYNGQNPPPNFGNTFSPPLTPGLPAAPPVAQIVRRNAVGEWRDDNGADWSAFVSWNVHDHDVAIIDTTTLGMTYASGMLTTVMAIAPRPDGQVSIVGTEALNEVRFESNLRGTFLRAEWGAFDPAAPTSTGVVDLNPHLTYAVPSIPVDQRVQSLGDPRGIAWTAAGDRAFITGMGSNNVIVAAPDGARLGHVQVGAGPTGIVLGNAGLRAFVLNKFDASISVIDTNTLTETLRVPFYDPTPTAVKLGRPLLYDTHATSGLGQAACASCHIDGRTDFLAWDLGDPSGQMKTFNQICGTPQCLDWHPLKGPMVTQSLQGIVGVEPLHWRGDREDLAAFSGAFTGLQGADAAPSPAQMQQFEDFLATIQYPPSPNRNIDGTMPAAIPTSGGGPGNPNAGLNLYQTLPVLPGGLTCASCHSLPTGTNQEVNAPMLALAPQSMKIAQLRGLWEKAGWRRNSQNNGKLFGFNHHSEFDTLNALLLAGFNFGAPAQAAQRRRDVEAFMLCFDTETHAAIGQQVTFDGANNNDAGANARLNTFVNLANAGATALIAKGTVSGAARGYVYSAGVMQSDRTAETTTVTALRSGAAPGSEMTFTVVPVGTQVRIGIDRDSDGYFDRDEIDACSDPADPAIVPGGPGSGLPADLNGDGTVGQADLALLLSCYNATGGVCGDLDADGDTDQADLAAMLAAYGTACP